MCVCVCASVSPDVGQTPRSARSDRSGKGGKKSRNTDDDEDEEVEEDISEVRGHCLSKSNSGIYSLRPVGVRITESILR
jgi:hypothetical protein